MAPTQPVPVVTAHRGANADLIAEVMRLYARPGMTIADVTYSTGRFWRKADLSAYRFVASDLAPAVPGVIAADLGALPYRDGSIDILVLDPPYVHNSGQRNGHDYAATTTRYNGRATVAGMYNADVLRLYRDGLREAFRVLNPDGGQCWIKCKDEVQREIQCWSHISIYGMALELGFCARDLFVLTGSTSPQRWPGRVQRHARKVHSFLWVMERPDARYRRLLDRKPPRGASRAVTSRRQRVAALLDAGATQRDIAVQLGVSQSTVRDDAAYLRQR